MKQETMPARENGTARRNKYFFGLGTIGRDMFYSMVSMFLLTYITEVLTVSDAMLLKIGFVLTVLRVFDALNDPIMGTLVDNTNTRWGKFKPLILGGAVTGAVFMVLLFTDLHLSDTWYIVLFAVFYLAWDVFYGANDIAYWSMMPALSLDQKERERIGAFAQGRLDDIPELTEEKLPYLKRADGTVVGILPVTGAMTEAMGSGTKAWFFFAVIVALLMLGFQCFTLFGVKEHRSMFKQEEKTTLKDTIRVIFKNDQLLFTTVAMALFMIGYSTTTSFGTYYFIYAYGDAGMYSVFAAVLGVSQLSALTVFPKFSARFTRKQLYFGATVLVVLGYLIFFFAPMNMIFIGAAGVLIFVGQAFIQLLMLMFLADTIEYGQWKTGKRNESVTFSIQPLINKIGGAIASGIVSVTLVISGINAAQSAADVTPEGLLTLKLSMLVLPLLCILAGYLVYRSKYRIDAQLHRKILEDLRARGDIRG